MDVGAELAMMPGGAVHHAWILASTSGVRDGREQEPAGQIPSGDVRNALLRECPYHSGLRRTLMSLG